MIVQRRSENHDIGVMRSYLDEAECSIHADIERPCDELHPVVGANGAGKTTLLNTVAGLLRPLSGRIRFDGAEIGGLPAERVVRAGLVLVPEGWQVVGPLSVEENLLVGAYSRRNLRAKDTLAAIYARFPRLAERRRQPAGLLSGGEQQMLTIGRALMAGPRMLLLDDPSMGLAPLMIAEIFRLLAELHDQGIALLVVEQNARKALALAHRGYVLEGGRVVLQGNASELAQSPAVIDAYLGSADGAGRPDGSSATNSRNRTGFPAGRPVT